MRKKQKILSEKEKIKEEKRKLKEKRRFDKAYSIALTNKDLPQFRVENDVMLIKRLSQAKLNKYKKIWRKQILEQIKEFTVENLYECWNEPFYVNIRQYNPHDIILQYFYWKHGIDLLHPLMPYKIVDSF